MSLHIHKFVDLIKATESRGQQHLQMTVRDAKDLHADISKLLITQEETRRIMPAAADRVGSQELSGGSFKNS